MTSREIRQQFIDFFAKGHGHTFVPSSPVVPLDDPTLLFTNAGMNQFKPIFLGQEKRPYTRAVNTQKCIRAGGKHNDLDDVGRSRRHHTFFEMLGNWSFGDYFKRGAIEMSWELLTKVWKLDPTRLHVTVYEGDPASGVPRDDEAVEIWRRVANWEQYGLNSADHIHYGGKDNFWEMGDTGPCGPCTEIFVDRTPDKTGGKTVLSGEDPRVMEIWNNVFIQYNRNPDRTLTVLPAQHVDTGMGFERIVQVLQGVEDNYGIDLFVPFWTKLSELSGRKYAGKYPPNNQPDPAAEGKDEQLRTDIAFRVIADHVRCLTFALTDGAAPSNEGRGYVLRRILRRAVRFGRQQLGLKDPFLHTLVPVVVEAMGDAFPELRRDPKSVQELVKDEEVSFGRTLDRGIELFDEAAGRSGGKAISGEDAFKLHDTFGFPIDLTQVMATERGMSVDVARYEALMEQARELARSGGKGGDQRVFELSPDALAQLSRQDVPATDDSAKFNAMPVGATVRAIWDGSKLVGETHGAEAAEQGIAIIVDKTNFYAEMGGQVGDTGIVQAKGHNARLDVTTTRQVGPYVLHVGRMVDGALKVGDAVTLTLAGVRPRTERNHTSTHLANWALREVLGEAVQQKGSLVDPEKLRFDFSHGKALADDELARVEQLVSQQIVKKPAVYAEDAPQEQALKINGLRAVFGEKYPPMVRVVSIGVPVAELLKDPANAKWRGHSIEFCGGTHLKNAGDAKAFVITDESSVSKGIRRIVALTGDAAEEAKQLAAELEKAIAGGDLPAVQKLLNAPNLPLLAKRRGRAAVADLMAKQKAAEKAAAKAASGTVDVGAVTSDLLAKAIDFHGGKVVVGEVPNASDDQLRGVMDSLRKKQPSIAALIAGSTDPSKVTFLASVSDDLIAHGLKAGDWAKEAAKVAGGGGGGRPQFAQAGGKDASKIPDALAAALQHAKSLGG